MQLSVTALGVHGEVHSHVALGGRGLSLLPTTPAYCTRIKRGKLFKLSSKTVNLAAHSQKWDQRFLIHFGVASIGSAGIYGEAMDPEKENGAGSATLF